MIGSARLSGLMAAGLLVVAIGFERFVNAMLLDGIASYTSVRFIVAVVCMGAGAVLLGLTAIVRRPRRRPQRYEHLE